MANRGSSTSRLLNRLCRGIEIGSMELTFQVTMRGQDKSSMLMLMSPETITPERRLSHPSTNYVGNDASETCRRDRAPMHQLSICTPALSCTVIMLPW